MTRKVFAGVAVTMCLAGSATAAGWTRQYTPQSIHRSTDGVIALSGGRALTSIGRVLVIVDANGNVAAARRWESNVRFAAGPNGQLYAVKDGHEPRSVRVVKLGDDLVPQWARAITAPDPKTVTGALAAARNGGMAVVGRTANGSYVIRLNANGETQWAVHIDPSDADSIRSIRATADGGFILAGQSRRSPWLVKLAADGSLQWQRTVTGDGEFLDAVEARGGGFIATGAVARQFVIAKIDARGNLAWSKASENNRLIGATVAHARGGYLVAATARDFKAVLLLSIDETGGLLWQRALTGVQPMVPLFTVEVLAATTGGTFFASPITPAADVPVLFRLDEQGDAGCSLFTTSNETLVNRKLVFETLPADFRRIPVVNRAVEVTLNPADVKGSPMKCGTAPAYVSAKPATGNIFREPTHDEVASRARTLLAKKDYTGLEKLAASLRAKRAGVNPIRPWDELTAFYEAFTSEAGGDEAQRLGRLRTWAAAQPASITARIALSRALYTAAWRRRGSSYSDRVTESGARGHGTLMEESHRVLASASGAEVDPVYWRHVISLTGERGGGDVRVLARRGLALHHDPEIARSAAQYLKPRWGGSMKVYLQWADEAARLTATTYGDILYMWLAYQAWFGSEDDFAEVKFDWNRIRRGHETLVKMAPKLVPTYHRYAAMARLFNDRAVAKSLFQKPELAWYEGASWIWKNRSRYEQTRTWALATPAGPFVDTPATGQQVPIKPTAPQPAKPAAPAELVWPFTPLAQWPQIVLSSRIKTNATTYGAAGFLVETPRGVVGISAVPDRPGRLDSENRIREMTRDLVSWTLIPPNAPGQVLRVMPLGAPQPENFQLGVALALPPRSTPWPVHVLEPAPANVKAAGRVYVVICGGATHPCKQQVLEGTVHGRNIGGPNKFVTIHITLERKLNPSSLIGAAVLNEDGYVVGVVTDRGGLEIGGAVMALSVDDVRSLLPK